jgi:hypothetical protein
VRTALCATLVLGVLAPELCVASESESRLGLDRNGRLTLQGLPAVLADSEVERHLSSGLTTSFVLRARYPGAGDSGAARVDVRFELWDEIYLVTLADGEGSVSELELSSRPDLERWWAEVEVVLTGPAEESPAETPNAKLTLDLVPFSQAELVDTQRWLAESMGGSRGGAPEGMGVSRAVAALIATSMQRRAVRSWSWSLPVERQEDVVVGQ